MIRLHDFPLSGHCHRVRLQLSLLGLAYESVHVDLGRGAHKEPAFLRLNPLGQVPVLEHDGVVLRDSNAIIAYLALRFDPARRWLPGDPESAAKVQEWLATANKELALGPARARLITVFGAAFDPAAQIALSHNLLAIYDAHLSERDWLATDHATIADVANYTYIAHAPEGNVDLEPYAHVRAWLGRVEALPGFVPMPRTAVGLWAEIETGPAGPA